MQHKVHCMMFTTLAIAAAGSIDVPLIVDPLDSSSHLVEQCSSCVGSLSYTPFDGSLLVEERYAMHLVCTTMPLPYHCHATDSRACVRRAARSMAPGAPATRAR